jgi:hypothetical protein
MSGVLAAFMRGWQKVFHYGGVEQDFRCGF